MHKYKDLKIWLKAMDLVTKVYETTAKFPDHEKFGLVSQINRSAVSIPSNIAEGAGRNSAKEFIQFLAIANGSSFELETQLMLSKNLNYLSDISLDLLLKEIDELQKMNFGFQARLKRSPFL
jgi:four helix bundle protein